MTRIAYLLRAAPESHCMSVCVRPRLENSLAGLHPRLIKGNQPAV